MDFGGPDPDECADGIDPDMTIGEMMELRYLKAEKDKDYVGRFTTSCIPPTPF